MRERKTILFYCQHSLGMGHLVRSLALAKSLSEEFRVILLNGGKLPRRLRLPDAVEIINLPPLGFDENNQLVSRDRRRKLERAQALREQLILQIYGAEKPEVVIVELFPFGRKKFANELLPLLEKAKGKSRIVCSLRDILVGKRKDQARHDERAIETANRLFNMILVHSDPKFAQLEDTFATEKRLQIPVVYTGFVAAEANNQQKKKPRNGTRRIIVSAGGGIVGGDLFRVAIEAHKILAKRMPVETVIAGGLFLPDGEWNDLQKRAAGISGLRLRRFIPDLRKKMNRSDVSISQCGYNTALDIVLSGVSAIVVPYGNGDGEDEQTKRARKLEEMGALKVCSKTDPQMLADDIEESLRFRPKPSSLNFNGGAVSTKAITSLLKRKSKRTDWLEPVKIALQNRKRPIKVFFRDDDAGIKDARFFQLLEVFENFDTHLDIAVIPKALSARSANILLQRIDRRRDLFSIHQHGFSHVNHELENRKCEFGPARSLKLQLADISEGKEILSGFFGNRLQPIFTPPWNRCSDDTVTALQKAGFKVLSRESKAIPLKIGHLQEIPVSIDWFAKRKGIPLTHAQVGAMIAEEISSRDCVGLMLHHAEMNKPERERLSDLLSLFKQFSCVETHSMWSLFKASVTANMSFARGL